MQPNQLTIKQASEKMINKELTSVELTQACLNKIKELNPKINALLTICESEALESAKKADQKRKNGENNPLLGIPYVAKDVLMTKGIKTTAASKILENYIAPFDATVIKKLNQAGAILLGKANCDEFAHGASGENSAYGPTKNPWDLEKVSGGSSSGPAASVASDMCLFALGTDTGGSIRCPASFCNLVGFKPSYGRCSRFGLMSMTSSTDTPGPIAKTTEDIALIMEVMAGHDENDATTPNVKVPNYSELLNKDIKNLKIGVPENLFENKNNDPEFAEIIEKTKQAIEKFKENGAEIINIDLKYAQYGIPVYYIITPSEISSNLARFDGIRFGFSEKESKDLDDFYKKTRGKSFGPEVKRRIMLGTYILSAGHYDAYYTQAQKVRTKIKQELEEQLQKVDLIITPTQPDTAFKIGEQCDDPLKMYLEDIFLAPASVTGLPAISIPNGMVNNMPIGVQLIGGYMKEEVIFKASYFFQQITDWHLEKPKN